MNARPGFAEYAWASHATQCARCKTVELARPESLANACWEGARLLKDALAELAAVRRAARRGEASAS